MSSDKCCCKSDVTDCVADGLIDNCTAVIIWSSLGIIFSIVIHLVRITTSDKTAYHITSHTELRSFALSSTRFVSTTVIHFIASLH
jgi:hypothetical protein